MGPPTIAATDTRAQTHKRHLINRLWPDIGSEPKLGVLIYRMPAKTSPTKSKRNAQKSRAKILAAATEEFSIKRYDGARMDAIAVARSSRSI
jgi:hypothetical protein